MLPLPRFSSSVAGILGLAGIASLTGLCGVVSAPSAHAQALQPGEILLNNFNGSNIQRYSASGTLEQTYTGTGATGTDWAGAAITPDGNIVTTFRNLPSKGIAIFSPDGSLLTTFLTQRVSLPGDVSVFADGTLAISDQPGAIRLYDQTGNFLSSLTTANNILGNTIGPDNTLWVAGQSENLFQFAENGTLLNTFSLSFNPTDLVVDPTDGSLWVADVNDNIVHLSSTDGSTLGSFNIGLTGLFDAIGISPDGKTHYATTQTSTVIQEFDTTGLTTGSITLSNPDTPHSLTVVPGTSSISTSAPEPGSLALLLPVMGTVGTVMRKRRKK